MIVGDQNTPKYGGFNTRLSHEQDQFVQTATKAVYTPRFRSRYTDDCYDGSHAIDE